VKIPVRLAKGKPCCYILQCANGSFYTGWTSDLTRRLAQHTAGRGGRYTRSHRPVELVYAEPQPDARAARKREAQIKALGRSKKEELVRKRRKGRGAEKAPKKTPTGKRSTGPGRSA
jgi:putative endonuclease